MSGQSEYSSNPEVTSDVTSGDSPQSNRSGQSESELWLLFLLLHLKKLKKLMLMK